LSSKISFEKGDYSELDFKKFPELISFMKTLEFLFWNVIKKRLSKLKKRVKK